MKKAVKWSINTSSSMGGDRHFFASSLASWRVDSDPAALVAAMKREGLPFNLWMVPAPISAAYEIAFFSPQVGGAVWLGFYYMPEVSK
jgi:hypothetical protein